MTSSISGGSSGARRHRPRGYCRRYLRWPLVGGAILALVVGVVIATGGGKASLPTLPPSPPAGHTAYFVSPHGDDANPGTLEFPWRTIARAMTQSYTAGDQLLFQRGGEYFGTIDKAPTPDESQRWLIGAYGEGARPSITNAKILDVSAAWKLISPNVWRIDLTDPATHGGWDEGSTNIGFLRGADSVFGGKRKSLAEVSAQWDFYDDNQHLYVYSTTNPTVLEPHLRAAPNAILINVHSHTEISGLELKDCGGHAIGSDGAPELSVSNVQVLDNEIHHIGGSYLIGFADGKVRYGNGIECFDSCSNWLVEGNAVYQIYDTAFTCQGADSTWVNIRVTRNHFHDNSHTIEFWAHGSRGGFDNILIDHNIFENGGSGWGGAVRPDQDNRAQFVSYGWTLPANILLSNNRIEGAVGSYRYHSPAAGYPDGWVFADNHIKLASGTLMENGRPYTIDDASSWAAATGTEKGSTFEVSDGS